MTRQERTKLLWEVYVLAIEQENLLAELVEALKAMLDAPMGTLASAELSVLRDRARGKALAALTAANSQPQGATP